MRIRCLILLFLFLLLWCVPARGAIAVDGTPGSIDNGATSSTTAQLSISAITAGDFVMCAFTFTGGGGNVFTSIKDANSNTYTVVGLRLLSGISQYIGIAYYQNAVGTSNEKTITLTVNTSTAFMAMTCGAFSGGKTSGALIDVSNTAGPTTSTNPTVALTTTCSGDLVVGTVDMSNNTPTHGSGFTSMGANTTTLNFTEYQVQSSAGAINANWTAASDTWGTNATSFIASGASCSVVVPGSLIGGKTTIGGPSVVH